MNHNGTVEDHNEDVDNDTVNISTVEVVVNPSESDSSSSDITTVDTNRAEDGVDQSSNIPHNAVIDTSSSADHKTSQERKTLAEPQQVEVVVSIATNNNPTVTEAETGAGKSNMDKSISGSNPDTSMQQSNLVIASGSPAPSTRDKEIVAAGNASSTATVTVTEPSTSSPTKKKSFWSKLARIFQPWKWKRKKKSKKMEESVNGKSVATGSQFKGYKQEVTQFKVQSIN